MEDRLELEAYLYENIPLTRAIGVHVAHADRFTVRLSAPFEPNVNHRRTVFGGSLAALAVLAGWGVVRCGLRAAGIDASIVVQRHSMEYLLPVSAVFDAECSAPPRDWQRFEKALSRRGRARIELRVNLRSAGRHVAALSGEYVAERRASEEVDNG